MLRRTSITIICWSELRDSNARSSDPKSGVLNQALLSSEFQDTHSFHPIESKKFAASVFLMVAGVGNAPNVFFRTQAYETRDFDF